MCDGEFQSELAKIDKRRLTPMLGQLAVKQPDKLKMVSPLIMNRYGFIGVKTNVTMRLPPMQEIPSLATPCPFTLYLRKGKSTGCFSKKKY